MSFRSSGAPCSEKRRRCVVLEIDDELSIARRLAFRRGELAVDAAAVLVELRKLAERRVARDERTAKHRGLRLEAANDPRALVEHRLALVFVSSSVADSAGVSTGELSSVGIGGSASCARVSDVHRPRLALLLPRADDEADRERNSDGNECGKRRHGIVGGVRLADSSISRLLESNVHLPRPPCPIPTTVRWPQPVGNRTPR
jgi:ParB-like chromosome segregation protein Spo0J